MPQKPYDFDPSNAAHAPYVRIGCVQPVVWGSRNGRQCTYPACEGASCDPRFAFRHWVMRLAKPSEIIELGGEMSANGAVERNQR
jgi:hypothetical protein